MMLLTTGCTVATFIVLALGPHFEFGRVLAFFVVHATTAHYHASACNDGLVVVNVTAGCSYLLHLFLMDSRPLMTFEIGARLEAFTAEFAEVGSLS